MGKVHAICISEKKGTQKSFIEEATFIENFGIENDAHAGKWHRQVSLLAYEKIADFNSRGAEVKDGAFGENLVVEGIDFTSLPIGTIFECIMPKNGVFTRVLKGGVIRVGDEMTYELPVE